MTPDLHWAQLGAALTVEQLARATQLRTAMRSSADPTAKRLADPADLSGFVLSPLGARELAATVRGFSEGPAATVENMAMVRALMRLLIAEGASLSLPPLHLPLLWPVNRLNADAHRVIRCVRVCVTALDSLLATTSYPCSLGILLLSTILRSGALSTDCLFAFLIALTDTAANLKLLPGSVCLDLKVRWPSNQEPQHRLLELDPQTAIMLTPRPDYSGFDSLRPFLPRDAEHMTLSRAQRRLFGHAVFALIKQELVRAEVAANDMPKDLDDLLRTTATALAMQLPMMVMDFADGSIIANSLKPASLVSVYGDVLSGACATNHAETEPAVTASESKEEEEDVAHIGDDPVDGLDLLTDALCAASNEEAVKHLQLIAERTHGIEPIWPLLAAFAISLLVKKKRRQKARSIKTVRWIVINCIGEGFGVLLEGDNPLEMSEEKLVWTYAEAVEDRMEAYQARTFMAPTPLGMAELNARARGYRARVSQAHCRFQGYLQDAHQAPEIDMGTLAAGGFGFVLVNAQILTLEAYRAARRYVAAVRTTTLDTFLCDYVDALLILGFRFGLRWSEGHWLKASDIFDKWIFVRPSDHRGLKTVGSLRKLPALLAPPDEFGVLVRLRQRAQQEHRDFLFSAPPTSTLPRTNSQFPVVTWRLMSIVRAALHSTGNRDLKYHHLRHSFATWTFWRLTLADLRRVPIIFPHLIETTHWLAGSGPYKGQTCKYYREQLLGRGTTSKVLEAVASLLGHSGTATSTEHYIHLFDRILPVFLRESSLLTLNPKQVIGVVGLSTSSLARAGTELATTRPDGIWPASGIAYQVVKSRFPELRSMKLDEIAAGDYEQAEIGGAVTFWAVFKFLARLSRSDIEDAAQQFGFSTQEGEQFRRRYQAIQVRHRDVLDLANFRNIHDKSIALAYAPALWTLAHDEPTKTKAFLREYVLRLWPSKNYGVFCDPADPQPAVAYRDYLVSLTQRAAAHPCSTANQRQAFLPALHHHFFGPRPHEIAKSRHYQQWKTAFRESAPKSIDTIEHYDQADRSPGKVIGIELLVSKLKMASTDCARSSTPNAAATFGGRAFSFLFTAAALAFGFDDN